MSKRKYVEEAWESSFVDLGASEKAKEWAKTSFYIGFYMAFNVLHASEVLNEEEFDKKAEDIADELLDFLDSHGSSCVITKLDRH